VAALPVREVPGAASLGPRYKDLPPRSTVNDYLRRWDEDRRLDRIHHTVYVLCRERADRATSPTAAIIASQSVKDAEKGMLHRFGGL
jgi:hypothetical protein